jgi:hypothetical protein
MRKKHGSVPKLHTCSGLDSHDEQKTLAFKVPLQTELRFPLRRYEQPHSMGEGLRSNRRLTSGSPPPAVTTTTSDPPLLPRPTGGRGGQSCRRHATAPGGRASLTPNAPAWRLRPTRHATGVPDAACKQQPPLAPPPRLFGCGTNTATRGGPARDPAAPAWRDGQYGRKWAGSNDGGRRAGAVVTSSARLTSRPGAAREPPLTA